MLKETTISVNSISKTFKLYESKRSFIKEAFHPLRKSFHRKFHALENISFKVRKGEVLGIIGQNGSGKSTLLRILASVVTPTSGEYYCKGRVTALLDISGGFNKDLTGIENIEFLGAIQGFSKNEIASRIKHILDFADIGDYAYQPISTYSSGMYMRLAFSLSINIDPDILLFDEVLAVGDIRFQQKCFRKIQEFKDKGKTIVLVTQSIDKVKSFCTEAIWLHEGKIRKKGSPNNVTEHYNAFMTSPETVKMQKNTPIDEPTSLTMEIDGLPSEYHDIRWYDMAKVESFGINVSCIQYASMINKDTNKNTSILKGGENVSIALYLSKQQKIMNPGIHLLLNGRLGSSVFRINSHAYKQPLIIDNKQPTIVTIDFVFPHIGNGRYPLSIGMVSLNGNTRQYIHWLHDALVIDVFNNNIKYKMGTPVVIEKATIQTQHSIGESV